MPICQQIFSPVATLNIDTTSGTSNSQKSAIIAGSAVGGATLILALLTVVFCVRHRQRRRQNRHHYLPTLRSMPLAGEDDFDLAAPRPGRGMMGLFGSFMGNSNERFSDAAVRPRSMPPEAGAAGAGEMQELNNESPPRILRPVASKTGSYFQEAVWPPPAEGSRLSDPLMAASHVDLTSIVDDVMGQNISEDPFNPEGVASTSRRPPPSPPNRLRGGALHGDDASMLSAAEDYGVLRAPWHESMRSISSLGTADSNPSPFRQHERDWSVDSQSGLLFHAEGAANNAAAGTSTANGRRLSRDGAPWVPATAHGRQMSGGSSIAGSPLRVSATSPPSAYGLGSAAGKAREAAEERRRSRLSVSNPDADVVRIEAFDAAGSDLPSPNATTYAPESPSSSYSSHSFGSLGALKPVPPVQTPASRHRSLAASISVSSMSSQRRRGTGEDGAMPMPTRTPFEDGPVFNPNVHRSVHMARQAPSQGQLVDIDDGAGESILSAGRVREELPPRYDMIRRDTLESREDASASVAPRRSASANSRGGS